ncbi:hypothetical protein KEM54_001821 [Ascosphaera aggregata]|nr:hypothetical protein KEM54_001821 [Ascosphaera aggregata]
MERIEGTLVGIRSQAQVGGGEPPCIFLDDVLMLARQELYSIGEKRRSKCSGTVGSLVLDLATLINLLINVQSKVLRRPLRMWVTVMGGTTALAMPTRQRNPTEIITDVATNLAAICAF